MPAGWLAFISIASQCFCSNLGWDGVALRRILSRYKSCRAGERQTSWLDQIRTRIMGFARLLQPIWTTCHLHLMQPLCRRVRLKTFISCSLCVATQDKEEKASQMHCIALEKAAEQGEALLHCPRPPPSSCCKPKPLHLLVTS